MNYAEIEEICKENGCFCERDFTLAPLTTMEIGGKCGLFIEPNSEDCLREVLGACRDGNIPYFLIGKGSNLLINRFSGAIIKIGGALGGCEFDGKCVTAGAGGSLAALCAAAANEGLTGMECLYGIPGSVGGALYMNAGAFGGEMKDIVKSARCLDERGKIVELSAKEMKLSYRHSVFCENHRCILSVTLELERGDADAVNAKMKEIAKKRRDKQPLEYPSCGSTFKRPENGFAAALIEECGLKGYTVGGAQVSEKHSGFVINRGGATFEDVMRLVSHIRKTVFEQKGVELECEMLILDS